MKLSITKKISLLVSLPLITIILFSLNHIHEKRIILEGYESELRNITIMKQGSALLHELQIERGLSAAYLYKNNNLEFASMLTQQYKTTDKELNKVISYIKDIDKKTLSHTNDKYFQDLKKNISNLASVRKEISNYTFEQEDSFNYYSLINKNIIALFKGLNLQTNSKKINADIEILNILVTMQEAAGQERALSLKLLNTVKISNKDKILYHKLIALQDDQYQQLNILMHNFEEETKRKATYKKYTNSFFMNVRNRLTLATFETELSPSTLQKSSDSKEWFLVSTNRINEIHKMEKKLFSRINTYIDEDIQNHFNALIIQISITILTIILLLLGTRHIAKKIRFSILQLENGLDNFFDFLNNDSEKPKDIQTDSDDEINDMAQRINTQMLKTEEHLEEDIDFINEITHIVTLMKDGDFSERPYFDPYNPHLKELKDVFNQLTDLISDKIKEQTDSLKDLNNSLEDRVHFQTLELEKQIQEITTAMEKALEAEIAKDEFLANMSHEIRTPLNAILGFVTILKKITKEEKSLHYLSIIDTSGKSLLTIINDILDFSKIKSGKFTITPHPINVVSTMSNAALLFASKAYEKYIVLAVYIDPHMPQKINIDSVRLIQIFSNLLSNAIKFTPNDGSIEVDVTCKDSLLKVSVKDTGIGIAEENISKVFSAFEQADGSTTRKYGGTGLGLSISYKLAQLMNGNISLTSKLGVGSTFTVILPLDIIDEKAEVFLENEKVKDYTVAILDNSKKQNKRGLIERYLNDFGITKILQLSKFQKEGYDLLFFTPDDEYNEDIVYSKIPAIALLRSSSIKLADLSHINPLYLPYTPIAIIKAIKDSMHTQILEQKEKVIVEEESQIEFIGSILVAEDNKTNQMLISLILDDYGLDFTMANDGLQAVELFKKGTFDLVLMDENMPELNGIGAMQLIKAYEKENNLAITPIIALTASVLETDKKKFIDAGMDGFVAKPIDTKELESELGRFLKHKD